MFVKSGGVLVLVCGLFVCLFAFYVGLAGKQDCSWSSLFSP